MSRRRCHGGGIAGPLVLLAAGCAPMSAPPPVHFLETARVLDRGAVSVTAAGGTGSLGLEGRGSGAGVRARYGVAGIHEAGAEVVWVGVNNQDLPSDTHPWLGPSNVIAAKLGWKTGLTEWLAVLAGLGGSHAATGNAIGGDLAAVISAPERGRPFRPYAGIRIAYASPVGRGMNEGGGPTRMAAAALGGAYRMDSRYRILLELALLNSRNRGYPATTADPYRQIGSWTRGGSFFAIGVERTFGGAPAVKPEPVPESAP